MVHETQIFVNVDLLLHEKEFCQLNDFVRHVDLHCLKDYDSFSYSAEEDAIIVESVCSGNLLDNFIFFQQEETAKGFILMTVNSLEKLLSKYQ